MCAVIPCVHSGCLLKQCNVGVLWRETVWHRRVTTKIFDYSTYNATCCFLFSPPFFSFSFYFCRWCFFKQFIESTLFSSFITQFSPTTNRYINSILHFDLIICFHLTVPKSGKIVPLNIKWSDFYTIDWVLLDFISNQIE